MVLLEEDLKLLPNALLGAVDVVSFIVRVALVSVEFLAYFLCSC